MLSDGKKVTLTLRLPESLRAAIEAEAKRVDDSMNNEIIRRLELSFQHDERAGGPENRKLLRLIEAVLFDVTEATGKEWSQSVYARIAVEEAIRSILDSFVEVPPLPPHGLLAEGEEAELTRQKASARSLAAKVGRDVGERLRTMEALGRAVQVLESLGGRPEDIARLKIAADQDGAVGPTSEPPRVSLTSMAETARQNLEKVIRETADTSTRQQAPAPKEKAEG